jgi:hypothetical protein
MSTEPSMKPITPGIVGAIAVYALAIIGVVLIFDPEHSYVALGLGLTTGAIAYHPRARLWLDRFMFYERDFTLRQTLLVWIALSPVYICPRVVNAAGGGNYTGESLLFIAALLLAIEAIRLASTGR